MSSNPPILQPTVLITGAAKRLGRDIALALASAGWRVAVHYRSSAADALKTVADCQAFSGASAAFCADLAVEAEVRRLFVEVVAAFGHVDAVVNSASTFEHDTAADFGFAAMEKHLRSNTGAPIVLAQALAEHVSARNAVFGDSAPDFAKGEGTPHAPIGEGTPHAAKGEGSPNAAKGKGTPSAAQGVVVNLLDQKLWNPNPDFLSYTLSKAALEAANTLLAMALAPHVRVVGVAPGLTLTSHLLSDAQFAALHQLSPLGRSSTAADVVATVKFALENQSITGTTLLVDGGQHLMKFDRDFSLM